MCNKHNRFLYVNSIYTIHQYDVEEPDIRGSGVLIAKADSTYEWRQPFMQSYATPNKRIILGTWGGSTTKLHVIDQPDSAGVACDFRKYSLFLPTVMGAASIANMINYDLGALPGCDTVYTAVVTPSLRGARGEKKVERKREKKAMIEKHSYYNKNLKPLANRLRHHMTKAEACLWKMY